MTAHQALSLLFLAIGAAVAPVISGRLGIPAAVGEILYGILVGLALPSSIELSTFVSFLAHFGFLLLMFLAGLEIDVQQLIRRPRRQMLRIVPFAVLVPLIGVVGALRLGQPALLGLVAGAISVGITLPVLQEMRLVRTDLGQAVLVVGAFGELCTILGLAVLGHLGASASSLTILGQLLKLIAVFGVAGIVLTILRELLWWFPEPLRDLMGRGDASELSVRAAVAVMVAFAALAVLVGVPDILATFLAGLTIAAVFPGRERLMAKLGTAGFGFFIPIFFINVGWGVDASAFFSLVTLRMIGLLFAATLAVRLLGLPALLWRLRPAAAGQALLLLAAPLTLQIAIAEFGIQQGLLPAALRPAVVAAASLSAILFPILARRSLNGRAAVVSGGAQQGFSDAAPVR